MDEREKERNDLSVTFEKIYTLSGDSLVDEKNVK